MFSILGTIADRDEVRRPNQSILKPRILPSDSNEQFPSFNKQATFPSSVTEDEAQRRINLDFRPVHTVFPPVNSVLPQVCTTHFILKNMLPLFLVTSIVSP